MKRFPASLFFLVALAAVGPLGAQRVAARPDLNGVWRVNVAESDCLGC